MKRPPEVSRRWYISLAQSEGSPWKYSIFPGEDLRISVSQRRHPLPGTRAKSSSPRNGCKPPCGSSGFRAVHPPKVKARRAKVVGNPPLEKATRCTAGSRSGPVLARRNKARLHRCSPGIDGGPMIDSVAGSRDGFVLPVIGDVRVCRAVRREAACCGNPSWKRLGRSTGLPGVVMPPERCRRAG
jgi:hypothetical protein